MHKNNIHKKGYDFDLLTKAIPEIQSFVFENSYGTHTIDFANPNAVKTLNKALLKAYYKMDYWEFPDVHLCPPIPGRVDYIHFLQDLLVTSKLEENSIILDIGTGATCIYPLLGNAVYDWQFIASDVDTTSLKNAQKIIDKNDLENTIDLRLQNDASKILQGVLNTSERISAAMCNPPFFKNEQ